MPTKKMKAVPSEIPKKRIFPSPIPIVEMSETTTTACKAECSTNNSLSHSIPSTVETVAKVGQIFRIAAFLQNEKWSVCVRAYYFAFSGYDILVEPYYKNALPIVGWDNFVYFVLLG